MLPRRCIHARCSGGCLRMDKLTAFEIHWETGDGDVELVGPAVRPMRFDTVGEAYRHWKRCFAPLSDAPLVVHAKAAGHTGCAMVRV